MNTSFPELFERLTGSIPFPWQTAFYERLIDAELPAMANIPTGLGKTSIVAIWLVALAQSPDRVPRRLVYVVNRRTVVDQTTTEVERLRNALTKPELTDVRNALASLCALPLPTLDAPPLAISTLRGQFADNGEWCTDPSRPSVVVGTVDMIGSGLLFSRYARGFKTRPHHAALLGQDVFLVHDEAHLEPAFQALLDTIATEQIRCGDAHALRVLQLTATIRTGNTNTATKPFGLDENPNDKDTDNNTVNERYHASKKLSLLPVTKITDGEDKANDSTVQDKIVELALNKRASSRAVLIFVRSVKAAIAIMSALDDEECALAPLTGTMRGKERDELVSRNPVFQRFLPERDRAKGVTPATGTVFLVATSAGEVGVNLSADDLVCDLSTYESMAQRFGRVNRFGKRDDSEILIAYRENLQASYDDGLEKAKSAKKDPDKKVAVYQRKNQVVLRIIKTLELLRNLNGNASPAALDTLPAGGRVDAFSPPPKMRVATDVQFDAWALTSIRSPIAARPLIVPYLHGEAEWQPPETHVAWREELDVLSGRGLRETCPPAELLDDFPLKPHELLRDTSERVHDQLVNLLKELQANGTQPPDAWLVRENGSTEVFPLIRLLADQDTNDDADHEDEETEAGESSGDAKRAEDARRNRAIALITDATLILPASLGGIENGLLSPNAIGGNADVADIDGQRIRVWSDSPEVPCVHAAGFRLVRLIDTRVADETTDDSEGTGNRYWLWLEAKPVAANGARATRAAAETLAEHTATVTANAAAIAVKLLPASSAIPAGEPDLRQCIVVAARLHDLGKNRAKWQRNLGNLAYDRSNPDTILAKSAPGMRSRTVAEYYRHEFGSLNDASADAGFSMLSEIEREIALHIVAAHHGRARPHFPADEIGDDATTPDSDALLATEIPRRFARLQKRFGRWGLAWLESILRAADYAASAGIVAANQTTPVGAAHVAISLPVGQSPHMATSPQIGPTATLAVNPVNPGHYFACCGLFELAARLSPNALAWFEQDADTRAWRFHLANTLPLADLLGKITAAEIVALDQDDRAKSALEVGLPNMKTNLRLDWWQHEGGAIGKLKPWAGNTSVRDIADDMRQAWKEGWPVSAGISTESVLYATNTANHGEPFYFDANRAVNARAQDVGFSADKLRKGGIGISTNVAPYVELLTLVGLQRARPLLAVNESGKERQYDYYLWREPLTVALLAVAVSGLLPDTSSGFRFSNPSRAKDYRAFLPAKFIS